MNVQNSIKKLKAVLPDCIPVLCWDRPNEDIFAVVNKNDPSGFGGTYYKVTPNGDVLGTNPVLSNLTQEGAKSI